MFIPKSRLYFQLFSIVMLILMLYGCDRNPPEPIGMRFNYIAFRINNPDNVFYSSVFIYSYDTDYRCFVYKDLNKNFDTINVKVDTGLYEVKKDYVQFSTIGNTVGYFLLPTNIAVGDCINIGFPSDYLRFDSILPSYEINHINFDTCYLFSEHKTLFYESFRLYNKKIKMVIMQRHLIPNEKDGDWICELKSYDYIYK